MITYTALFIHPYNISHDKLPKEIDEARKFLKGIIANDDTSIRFHTTSFDCFKYFLGIQKYNTPEVIGVYNAMVISAADSSIVANGIASEEYNRFKEFLLPYDIVFVYTGENSKESIYDPEEEALVSTIKFVYNSCGGNHDVCNLVYDKNNSVIRPNDTEYIENASIIYIRDHIDYHMYPLPKVALILPPINIIGEEIETILVSLIKHYLNINVKNVLKYGKHFDLDIYRINEVGDDIESIREIMNEYDYAFTFFGYGNNLENEHPHIYLKLFKVFRDMVLLKDVYTSFEFRAHPISVRYDDMGNSIFEWHNEFDIDNLYDRVIELEKKYGLLKDKKEVNTMKNEEEKKETSTVVEETAEESKYKIYEADEQYSEEESVKEENPDEIIPTVGSINYPVCCDTVKLQSRVFNWLCAKARVNGNQLNQMFTTIDNLMSQIKVGSEIHYYNKPYIVTDIIDRENGVIKLGIDSTGCGYVINSFIVQLTENNAWKQYSIEYKSNDEPSV